MKPMQLSMLVLALNLLGCGNHPGPAGSSANSILVTVTGEAAATDGTVFPPLASEGEPYFLDGWEVTYQHVLLTVGSVEISDGPDTNPHDQSVTGPLVAQAVGPWQVDLAQAGPLEAKEQNGTSWPLTTISNQNQKPGSPPFEPTAKYALSYSLVTAVEGAININLDAQAQAAYQLMVSKGWSVWLEGNATWKGGNSTPACRTTDATYDFERLPKVVHFAFGFNMPVNFKNCLNPEIQPIQSRGLQTQSNRQTTAQLTFHLDHPFWEALAEDAPLRWDAIAAQKSAAVGPAPAKVDVTEADLTSDVLAPRDAQGGPIPWRTCGPTQANERTTGSVSFDSGNVPVNPAGGAAGLQNLADYMRYNLATFGHLNNDGLCFPERQYPSPW